MKVINVAAVVIGFGLIVGAIATAGPPTEDPAPIEITAEEHAEATAEAVVRAAELERRAEAAGDYAEAEAYAAARIHAERETFVATYIALAEKAGITYPAFAKTLPGSFYTRSAEFVEKMEVNNDVGPGHACEALGDFIRGSDDTPDDLSREDWAALAGYSIGYFGSYDLQANITDCDIAALVRS